MTAAPTQSPRTRQVIVLRLALLIAVFASAALFIEYQNAGDPAFCGTGSGCMEVRKSQYSHIGMVPLPLIGLVAFGVLFGLAMAARSAIHHRLVAAIAGFGGVLAALLLVLQATAIGAFCKWCVAVDTSAIVAAIAAATIYMEARNGDSVDGYARITNAPGVSATWAVAGLLAALLPFVWARYPEVPPIAPQLAKLSVPGKVNIIQFTDFECPYCRKLHLVVDRLREENGPSVHLVRLMMPLPGHRGAMPAALAYACAPPELKDALAGKLYGAEVASLSRNRVPDVAESLGADKAKMAACIAGAEARAIVDSEIALFKQIEGRALPLTYIGDRAVLGYNPERLLEMFAIAKKKGQPSLPVWAMLAALSAALAGAAAVTVRGAAKRGLPTGNKSS